MTLARIAVALLLVVAALSVSGWHRWPAGWIALFLTIRVAADLFVTEYPKTWGLLHRAANANIGWIGALASGAALIAAMFLSSLPSWVVAIYGFAATWVLMPPIFVSVVFLLVGMADRLYASQSRNRRAPTDSRAIVMPDVSSGALHNKATD